jgi:hypothetical protein
MNSTNFQLTLSANDHRVQVQVLIPHDATQTIRQVIFELLAEAFAVVESTDTQAIRQGMLSGIDELITREDQLVLQRHYVDEDYPDKLHAALSVTPGRSLSLH